MKTMKSALTATPKEKRTYCFKNFQTNQWYLYPLMVFVWYATWIRKKLYFEPKWDEKKAQRILETYFAKYGEIDREKEEISRYFRKWGFFFREHVAWYDKKFCRIHNNKLISFMCDAFEVPGFVKSVEDDGEWILITFKTDGITNFK